MVSVQRREGERWESEAGVKEEWVRGSEKVYGRRDYNDGWESLGKKNLQNNIAEEMVKE